MTSVEIEAGPRVATIFVCRKAGLNSSFMPARMEGSVSLVKGSDNGEPE